MLFELSISPVQNQQYYEESLNPRNRLFRTPLIKIENYYILSNWLLLETVQYFKYIILKNQLSFNINKKIRNVVTKNFDEFELTTLDEIIKNNSRIGAINFSLNKRPVCKHLFHDTKNLPQQLDCYIFKYKHLYIMEMKNNAIRTGLKGIRKDRENTTKGKCSYKPELVNSNR